MKIAAVQFAPVLGNLTTTIKVLQPLLEHAKDAELIVLPELANSGYRFGDREEARSLSEDPLNSRFVDFLIDFCRRHHTAIVSGFNERAGDLLFNSSLIINQDGIIGKYRKIHLFMDEKNFFEPGDKPPEIYVVNDINIGMLVCFDWMFPELWRILALKGADLICHPSNLVIPQKAQKAIPVHAMINRIFVILTNRTGTERDLTFTGNSIIADPEGRVVVSGSGSENEILLYDIDPSLSRNKMITSGNHVFNDRRPDLYSLVTNNKKNY